MDFSQLIEQLKAIEAPYVWLYVGRFLVWSGFILVLAWLLRVTVNGTVRDNAARYRAKKVIKLVSYLLIVLIAISVFTGQIQNLGLAIGLITAGIAFALQEVILGLAGWVAIFTTNIYKTGDRIEINGVKGDVIDIGVTKTTLMEMGEWISSDNYSGRIVQVNNAFVFKGAVHNYSTDFPFVWDEINIPIRYNSEVATARKIITEVAEKYLSEYATYANQHWQKMVKKYLIEHANVEPSVTVKLTDNWIEFNLRYVVDYKKRRSTKDILFSDILDGIEATNGAVSLASTSIEIISTKENPLTDG